MYFYILKNFVAVYSADMYFYILKNFVAVYSADMSQQENQLMQIQQEINNVSKVFHYLPGVGGKDEGSCFADFISIFLNIQ